MKTIGKNVFAFMHINAKSHLIPLVFRMRWFYIEDKVIYLFVNGIGPLGF